VPQKINLLYLLLLSVADILTLCSREQGGEVGGEVLAGSSMQQQPDTTYCVTDTRLLAAEVSLLEARAMTMQTLNFLAFHLLIVRTINKEESRLTDADFELIS
jgi:hypothetical protein